MNKMKETIMTMVEATQYSFCFCWRNCKKDTIIRLVISMASTVMIYLGVQANGLIFNAVQRSLVQFKGAQPTLVQVMQSGLLGPIMFMVAVLLVVVVLSRPNWFFKNRWSQVLRFANQREINDHRGTLDVARFRSEEFDDLEKRIQELPTSWQTRIWFSEAMVDLFMMIISFVLFGASLLWYKPMYALILVVMALPVAFMKFKLVAMWWSLFQQLTPVHKRRYVLEKCFHRSDAFVQAKMFNQLPALRKDIDVNVGGVLESYERMRDICMKKEMMVNILTTLSLCAVVIHAVWSTVTFAGEIGTLTIIIAAARTFQGNLDSILSLVAEQWNSAKGVILIEKDYLGLKPMLQTPYPVVPSFDVTPQIRFDNVCFAYPNSDVEVLKNVSFVIEPGTKVAIVGKSGNGKSTLQALMMRHYDPTAGSVFAGNVNLRNIEPAVWNNVVSALTQEYAVLERKIGEEIASSRMDRPFDMDMVVASARFANFDDVVAQDPLGYGAQIGVEFGGREFSGGERHRLALARAHCRGTPILILDEPDAKLDPESAQKVIDHVFALTGVTVIIITHHVARAERCDKVIVMGKGEIVEDGTHEELIKKNGVYAKMYRKDKARTGNRVESDA